jgi:hypothetical protein
MKYPSLLGAVLFLLFVLPGPDPAAAGEPNGAAETAAPRGASARITGYTSGQGKVFGPKQRVIITRIDHEKVHGPRLFSFESNPQDLSPGRHIISVQIYLNTSSATGRLWLEAEAGKSYIVRKRIEGYGVYFWIEETDTGRVVGGVQPGDD